MILAFAWLSVWSMPMSAYYLVSYLESAYPPLPMNAVSHAQAIVVLGGNLTPAQTAFPYENLYSSADRMWHAARLYKAGKAPVILLSGGADMAIVNESEAKAMARFMIDLGIPESALILEENSRTTSDNAAMSAVILKKHQINHILLVTTATHTPRATRLFRAQGLEVEPIAIDHEATSHPHGALAYLPDAGALATSASAFKELVGRFVGLLGINR